MRNRLHNVGELSRKQLPVAPPSSRRLAIRLSNSRFSTYDWPISEALSEIQMNARILCFGGGLGCLCECNVARLGLTNPVGLKPQAGTATTRDIQRASRTGES
jgi:hypothetical protein